jgi:hypothetical protein
MRYPFYSKNLVQNRLFAPEPDEAGAAWLPHDLFAQGASSLQAERLTLPVYSTTYASLAKRD